MEYVSFIPISERGGDKQEIAKRDERWSILEQVEGLILEKDLVFPIKLCLIHHFVTSQFFYELLLSRCFEGVFAGQLDFGGGNLNRFGSNSVPFLWFDNHEKSDCHMTE